MKQSGQNQSGDGLLTAKAHDAAAQTAKQNRPHFVGFLSENESAAVSAYVKSAAYRNEFGTGGNYAFFGGHDNAERLIFAALPDWADCADDIAFPIIAVKCTHRLGFSLSHSDYLGALMSLGIERDRVGDIIIQSDGAYIFLHESVCDYVISQLETVGRVGVKLEKADFADVQISQKYKDISLTVASARLDCVVAAICRISRTKAALLINSRLVFVNGMEMTDTSKQINGGDTVTVRKKGKYIIDSVENTTKKGRTILIARQRI